MLRWAEIARNNSKDRFEGLSKYLTKKGIENQLEFVVADDVNFEEQLKLSMQKYDQIRIGAPFGELVNRFFTQFSSSTLTFGASDAVVKIASEWWPRLFLHQAILKMISAVGEHIDFNASVLIVGTGAAARACCSAFIQVGFKSIHVTTNFDDDGFFFIKEMKRNYFDVDFKYVSRDRLVMLPGTNSVLVNTTPNVAHNEILPELFYFNFLKPPGMVWDFNINPPETPLLKEAQAVQIPVVKGFQLASWTDVLWSEQVTGKKLDHAEYEIAFLEMLESVADKAKV